MKQCAVNAEKNFHHFGNQCLNAIPSMSLICGHEHITYKFEKLFNNWICPHVIPANSMLNDRKFYILLTPP